MYGERRPEFDPDQFMRNLRDGWERFRSRLPGNGGTGGIAAVVIGIAVAIWLATGIYIVQPGERAAVQLFGEFRGIEEAGLNWYFPRPIGAVTIENVEGIRSMESGFRIEPERRAVAEEAHMITGDLNIANIEMVVQYRIADLYQYLFRVADPGDPDREVEPGRPDGRTLRDAAEAALRQVVGQRGIDDVLTVARAEAELDTREMLQDLLDGYETGIQVTEVILQDVRPPEEVREAFDDVVSARLDQEARINEARAYEQDQIPRAEGAAQQIIQAAQAFRDARVAEARGEAAQFISIWEEYQNSPQVTRDRLYLESMERVLPGVDIFVLGNSQGTGNGALPLLPLAPMNPPPPTPAPGPGGGG